MAMSAESLAPSAAAVSPQQTTPAVERVFAIPELLEDILLRVLHSAEADDESRPLQTILLSQRVSKSFNATANGSKAILRELWMVAGDLPAPLNRRGVEYSDVKFLNPIFASPSSPRTSRRSKGWKPTEPPIGNLETLISDGEAFHSMYCLLDHLNKGGSWMRMSVTRATETKQTCGLYIFANKQELRRARCGDWKYPSHHLDAFECTAGLEAAELAEKVMGYMESEKAKEVMEEYEARKTTKAN